ncbi:hypothetical protein U1Q18_025280 [Sarracenia purpurea var. burkii]
MSDEGRFEFGFILRREEVGIGCFFWKRGVGAFEPYVFQMVEFTVTVMDGGFCLVSFRQLLRRCVRMVSDDMADLEKSSLVGVRVGQ